eukprot:12965209-Ditylum_brightwellii.AAC.1
MDAITQVIKGQGIQDRDVVYLLVKSLLKGDALKVFKSEEASQETKDGLAFTKALRQLPNVCFPRRPTRRRKSTSGTS